MIRFLRIAWLWLFTGWVEPDPAEEQLERLPKYWTDEV